MKKSHSENPSGEMWWDWVRIGRAEKITSLSRSLLYVLKDQAKIRTKLVKVTGTSSGIRMVSLRSLHDFIETQGE